MADGKAEERAAHIMMEAVYGAIDKMQEAGDEEALMFVGPQLFMAGLLLMIKDMDLKDVVEKLRELASLIEDNRLGNAFGWFTEYKQ